MSNKNKSRPARSQARRRRRTIRKPKMIPISAGFAVATDLSVRHLLPNGSLLESLLQFDQHGRLVSAENVVSNNVVRRPWKRSRRAIWEQVARHCFPPDGKAPERFKRGQIILMMTSWARRLKIKADPKESTILRAVGYKK
jgi:hypothetical protein